MKILIERKTGQITTTTDVRLHSGHMHIFGKVERLVSLTQSIWYPTLDEVEVYLASLPAEDFVAGVTALEGNFLILWRDHPHIRICHDRYSLHPIYCRITPVSIELFDCILDGSHPLTITQDSALAFLLLRFVPGRRTLFEGIDRIMPGDCLTLDTTSGGVVIETACVYPIRARAEVDEETACQTFHALFREGLERRIQTYNQAEKLLLPLSGGLDSRYVLGTALELVAPSRIIAMTFGAPGSYDFEIGRLVAETAGVKHVAYPLSPPSFTAETFWENCRDTDGQISFTTEAPVGIYEDFSQYGSVILSGYVGDAVMGKQSHSKTMLDQRSIVLEDMIVKSSDPLTGYLDFHSVKESFYYQNGQFASLGASELWFFINHFTKYSIYCVCKLRGNFKYINPFVDYAFLDYFLNLPSEFRINRKLYIAWLQHHFPDLASLPSSAFRGASLSSSPFRKGLTHQWDRLIHYGFGINRNINKIDLLRYYRQLLEPDQLRQVFANSLPPEFMQRLFSSRGYYFLLYNLKCLEILQSNFTAKIM